MTLDLTLLAAVLCSLSVNPSPELYTGAGREQKKDGMTAQENQRRRISLGSGAFAYMAAQRNEQLIQRRSSSVTSSESRIGEENIPEMASIYKDFSEYY